MTNSVIILSIKTQALIPRNLALKNQKDYKGILENSSYKLESQQKIKPRLCKTLGLDGFSKL